MPQFPYCSTDAREVAQILLSKNMTRQVWKSKLTPVKAITAALYITRTKNTAKQDPALSGHYSGYDRYVKVLICLYTTSSTPIYSFLNEILAEISG